MENFYKQFLDLGLSNKFYLIFKRLNYVTPFPIQKICIPNILKNIDILGIANTGSGKTAAFILPILEKINKNVLYSQSLILVPTRELAIQIHNVINIFSKNIKWINSIPIYGGQNFSFQINLLKKTQHIIIATPGRLIDHINKKTINLSKISILVIDEADEMLKMGFINDINNIVSNISNKRQTLLFSATMPKKLKFISYKFFKNKNFKEIIINKKNNDLLKISQYYYIINNLYDKKKFLINFLLSNIFNSIIIFVNTKSKTIEIHNFIKNLNYNSLYLNGDMKQYLREKTIKSFKINKMSILIATDVASRGLDINKVDWVINFDCPTNEDTYIHRIGRTGRAGNIGKSLSFFTNKEFIFFKNLKNINIKLLPINIKNFKDLFSLKIDFLIKFIEKNDLLEKSKKIDDKKILILINLFKKDYISLIKILLKIIFDKNLII